MTPAILHGTASQSPKRGLFTSCASGPCSRPREIGNLLPNNRRQRRTCYALCHILYPVSAAHTSIFRMDSNSTSYSLSRAIASTYFLCFLAMLSRLWGASKSTWERSARQPCPRFTLEAKPRILSTDGRGVRLCWAHSKTERPKRQSSRSLLEVL